MPGSSPIPQAQVSSFSHQVRRPRHPNTSCKIHLREWRKRRHHSTSFYPMWLLQAASKGQVESIPILGRERLRAEEMENKGLKVWPAMECPAAQVFPGAPTLQFVCILVSVVVPFLAPLIPEPYPCRRVGTLKSLSWESRGSL